MILDNGTLEAKITIQGGIENGVPVQATYTWDKPIPCHIATNQNNNRGVYDDGKYKQLAFTIWFDTPLYDFNSNSVRLTDNKGKVLGEFQVQSVEQFDLTGRTRIAV